MFHPNQPIISPLLVGRVGESDYLGQALAAARQGQGAVVLLAGEAGVGKSRLAQEVRRQAAACGFDVLIGHCFEYDTGSAYALLIDALRTWLAPLPESAVATLLGVRAAEVVKLLPELAHTIPNLQPTAALDAEAEKQRLIESLYRVCMQSALPPKSTPLLLIAEDLHWSDENSLDFLHLLARRAAQLPLLVVGTYRREDCSPTLRQWLGQLARERLAHELLLSRLSRDEVETMVRAIFRLEDPVPAESASDSIASPMATHSLSRKSSRRSSLAAASFCRTATGRTNRRRKSISRRASKTRSTGESRGSALKHSTCSRWRL